MNEFLAKVIKIHGRCKGYGNLTQVSVELELQKKKITLTRNVLGPLVVGDFLLIKDPHKEDKLIFRKDGR